MENKKEYFKNYYQSNKEKMDLVSKQTYARAQRRKMVEKLNKGGYQKLPYLKIEEYKIVKNPETGLYE